MGEAEGKGQGADRRHLADAASALRGAQVALLGGPVPGPRAPGRQSQLPLRVPPGHPEALSQEGPTLVTEAALLQPHPGEGGILFHLHSTAGKLRPRRGQQPWVTLDTGQNPSTAPPIPYHPGRTPEDWWAPTRHTAGAHGGGGDASSLALGEAAGATPPSLGHPTSEDRGKPWASTKMTSPPTLHVKVAGSTPSRKPSTLPFQVGIQGPSTHGQWIPSDLVLPGL